MLVFVFVTYKIVYGMIAVPIPAHVRYSNRVSNYWHAMTFRQISTLRDYYKYLFPPLP